MMPVIVPRTPLTITGIIVSIVFYLLIATALGSFVGLYFFRQPPQE